MVQFEAGLRAGELYDLRIGDVFDGDHTTGLHVDGKLGERSVHLIISVPSLQAWLNDSRCPNDPEAYFLSKLGSDERPSYQGYLKCFRGPGERASIETEVTPTAFRKANTRWLVNQGVRPASRTDRDVRGVASIRRATWRGSARSPTSARTPSSTTSTSVGRTTLTMSAPSRVTGVIAKRCGRRTSACGVTLP